VRERTRAHRCASEFRRELVERGEGARVVVAFVQRLDQLERQFDFVERAARQVLLHVLVRVYTRVITPLA
jgi:hypothetical protein